MKECAISLQAQAEENRRWALTVEFELHFPLLPITTTAHHRHNHTAPQPPPPLADDAALETEWRRRGGADAVRATLAAHLPAWVRAADVAVHRTRRGCDHHHHTPSAATPAHGARGASSTTPGGRCACGRGFVVLSIAHLSCCSAVRCSFDRLLLGSHGRVV